MNCNYAVHHVYFLENGSISMTRILNAQKGIPQTANGKLQTAVCSPWETSILRCLITQKNVVTKNTEIY